MAANKIERRRLRLLETAALTEMLRQSRDHYLRFSAEELTRQRANMSEINAEIIGVLVQLSDAELGNIAVNFAMSRRRMA